MLTTNQTTLVSIISSALLLLLSPSVSHGQITTSLANRTLTISSGAGENSILANFFAPLSQFPAGLIDLNSSTDQIIGGTQFGLDAFDSLVINTGQGSDTVECYPKFAT